MRYGRVLIGNDAVEHGLAFTFEGAAATVPFWMELNAFGQYAFADLGDTATFSFAELPDGVSYTSASGDFLAGPGSRPRTIDMGHDAARLRWHRLHGLSSEVKASIDGCLISDHRVGI